MDDTNHPHDDMPTPLLGARRAWPSLCYGTILSCLIHGSAIAAILLGFPILHLILDQESAATSLTVVSEPQEATQEFGETGVKSDHDPNDDIRKGGEQFIADTPETKKVITETSDIPTTKGRVEDDEPTPDNGIESQRVQSDPTPEQDNNDHPQEPTQAARDAVNPQPVPQKSTQPSRPKTAQSEQRPSGASVVLVDTQTQTSDHKPSSDQAAATEAKAQAKTASEAQAADPSQSPPAKIASNTPPAAKSLTDSGPTKPNQGQRQSAEASSAEEADASDTDATAAQRAEPVLTAQTAQPAQPPTDTHSSNTQRPPTSQPLTRDTGIIAAPKAPTSVAPPSTPADSSRNPLPAPRTPSQVVDQLADALPRIAAIRNGILSARKRPPGTMVAAADSSQSVERLEKFAEQGYAHAQFALAEMMLTGEGLPRDPKRGTELATKAALNGYLPAQLLLGALAADGGSVDQPRDLGEAYAWLTLAAGNDSKAAALAVKALTPMLEVKDIIHSKQRLSEMRQLSALVSPQTNSKLSSKEAGDRLRQAAALGDVETVTIMLAQGADADSSDEDGRTALIEASWRGYANIVSTLIQQGANVSQVDASGKSPLAWAAINGYATVAKILLDAGQSPDTPDVTGITPLMRAAWNDRPGVVKVLLDGGANPNLHDGKNMSALDYATREKHSDIVYLLRGVTK